MTLLVLLFAICPPLAGGVVPLPYYYRQAGGLIWFFPRSGLPPALTAAVTAGLARAMGSPPRARKPAEASGLTAMLHADVA
jgi:hypothetical protein